MGTYLLSVLALLSVADAAAALRAVGHTVTRTTGADAARRYGCQTLLYVVDGRACNIGRFREMGAEALAAIAPGEPDACEAVAHLCRKFPVSNPSTWAPAVARLQARGSAVTVAAILREAERPGPVLPGEPQPVAAPVADAAPVVLPGEDPEAVVATLPTRFAGGGFAGLEPWGNMPGYPRPGANPAAGTLAMG